MEFLNVGGGELLIIILLALVLFSPEDILKLMRSIGKYARTARQMWSNVSASLQEDYIPEEVKEVVKETADTVKEASTTLSDVRQQFGEITASVEDEVSEATQLAESRVSEAVDTVNETPLSEENDTPDEETEIKPASNSDQQHKQTEIEASSDTDQPDGEHRIEPSSDIDQPDADVEPSVDEETLQEQHILTTQAIIESLLHPPKEPDPPAEDTDEEQDPDSLTSVTQEGEILADIPLIQNQDESTTLTKEDMKNTQEYKSPIDTSAVNAKFAKVTEDLLKDAGNGS